MIVSKIAICERVPQKAAHVCYSYKEPAEYWSYVVVHVPFGHLIKHRHVYSSSHSVTCNNILSTC